MSLPLELMTMQSFFLKMMAYSCRLLLNSNDLHALISASLSPSYVRPKIAHAAHNNTCKKDDR